jgi:predicted CXXCH cytochrome family protein
MVFAGPGETARSHKILRGALTYIACRTLILASLSALTLNAGHVRAEEAASPSPLDWGTKPISSHAPYEAGQCSACHEKRGPNPGTPGARDLLCMSCHEDVRQHAHAFRNCVKCHNAHNSVRPHLLRADIDSCRCCHRQ